MRRILVIAILALAAAAAPSQAQLLHKGCCPDCTSIPPADCPDCTCPCDHRLHLTLFGSEHAQKLICDLQSGGDCCVRTAAAKKLGCRLHADFCCDPCVLDALIGALLTDPCWEVRRAAAWAFVGQDAGVEKGVLALYISSKLDPHYMVRSRAAEALDIVTLCRAACFKELYSTADRLIVELKAKKFKPGAEGARVLIADAFPAAEPIVALPAVVPPPKPEPAPLPKGGAQLAPPPANLAPGTPYRTLPTSR
jgi:hypothetical protein